MTTTNNFYIIDEHSKHDVIITEYNAEDYIGWYRVIYDSDGSIATVVEITQKYLDSVGLSDKGENWTLTKWFSTSKDNEATLTVDESLSGGTSEKDSITKYFVDEISRKEISPNEYSNYFGWYRIIRDEKGNITDIIEITEDNLLPIYFNDPVWEITKSYRINESQPDGFIYNSSKKNSINNTSSIPSIVPPNKPVTPSKTEKLKAIAIKNAPKVGTVEVPETCVNVDCVEYNNPYCSKTLGTANKYKVDLTAKRVK